MKTFVGDEAKGVVGCMWKREEGANEAAKGINTVTCDVRRVVDAQRGLSRTMNITGTPSPLVPLSPLTHSYTGKII